MKKIIHWLSVSLVLSFLLCIAASAASSPTFRLKSDASHVEAGDSFSVLVEISGNSGIDGFEGGFSYDSDILTCTAIKSGKVLKDSNALFTANPKKALFASISAYPISDNGTILEVTFRANKSGSASVAFKNAKVISNGQALDITASPITFTVATTDKEVILPEEPVTPTTPAAPETPSSVTFSDVPTTHWAYTYIQKAVSNGLFSGIGNGQFGPALNVTRGMFVTTLYSSAGSPDVELSNFTDVPANAWYAKAVAWASQQGIVSGIGNNKFGPDMPITREQIALILFNYADGVSPGTEMFVRMAYPDAKDIHDWALTAFTWAMNKDLISGKSGNILDPLATATRAEVAVIMQNFVNLSK